MEGFKVSNIRVYGLRLYALATRIRQTRYQGSSSQVRRTMQLKLGPHRMLNSSLKIGASSTLGPPVPQIKTITDNIDNTTKSTPVTFNDVVIHIHATDQLGTMGTSIRVGEHAFQYFR